MLNTRFRIKAILRLLLLAASILTLTILAHKEGMLFSGIVLGAVIVMQIWELIHFVERSNRNLLRFLDAVRYGDYSQTFGGSGSSSLKELDREFNVVLEHIRRARQETEEQYQYLQTVVQHVGVGLLCFRSDGKVELINSTAKRLLEISELRDLEQLHIRGQELVASLWQLKPGQQTLVKLAGEAGLLHLAISAAQFRMRGHDFTLVSIQDIGKELESERLTHELQIARQVQQQLLPTASPQVPGFFIAGACYPATEVGGDYYDFVPLSDGKLGIVIGDVSGKGAPAAIYMTLTKGVLQSNAIDGDSPKVVLTKVNRLLYEAMERGTFVSMFYAVLDWRNRTLTCARAGHNPALHLNGEHVTWLEPGGLALGLENNSVFVDRLQEISLELPPGSVVVFYTDGLTEAMNHGKEEFGEARLLAEARAQLQNSSAQMIDHLSVAVRTFAAGAPQHDDMTMIAIKAVEL